MKLADKWKRGLPYVGNKGQKAEQIIDLLPPGNRLIDTFGGGVASRLPHQQIQSGTGSFITTFVPQLSSF